MLTIFSATSASAQHEQNESSPLLHHHNDHERMRYTSGASAFDSLQSFGAPDEINFRIPNHDHDHVTFNPHSPLRSMILLIALSFHSVFEGLAIGLQKDLGQLMSLFLAVIGHKGIMAFSLGLTLAQANLNFRQYFLAILVFSAASPLGMGIGIAVSEHQNLAADIANGVLQGIAGGTFLYITFFEVLPHEFRDSNNRMLKIMAILIGYGCICGLLFVTH